MATSFRQDNHGRKTLLIILMSFGLASCGGGGGGSAPPAPQTGGPDPEITDPAPTTPPAVQDTSAPVVNILTPKYSKATTSSVVEVTGTASDDMSGVASVTVNGVEATSDDSFASWKASVPVGSNISSLVVVAKDAAGNASNIDHSIRINKLATIFSEPSTLNLDKGNNQLLITDALQGQIFAASLSNPNLKKLIRSGEEYSQPSHTTFDQTNSRGLILDAVRGNPQVLQSFDAVTGAKNEITRSVSQIADMAINQSGNRVYLFVEPARAQIRLGLYDITNDSYNDNYLSLPSSNSSGDTLDSPTNLKYDSSTQHLYYVDNGTLVKLNPETGTSTFLSDNHTSDGIQIISPVDLALDTTNNKAWIVDSQQQGIIEINMTSGARRILSSNSAGSGPEFKKPGSLVADSENNRLLVSDTELNLVFTVDLSDGNRELFLSNRYGSGTFFDNPVDIALDASSNTAYVSDSSLKSVFSVDLSNGNRTVISGTQGSQVLGSGNAFSSPGKIDINAASLTAWLVDRNASAIISVDLNSGNRNPVTVSDPSLPKLQIPAGIDFIDSDQNLLISDIYNDNILKLSPASGTGSVIANKKLSNGTLVDKATSVAMDTANNKVYAIDTMIVGIVEWNLTTGQSRVLSKLFVGQGNNFSKPEDIEVDSTNGRLIVSDSGLNAVLSVDIANGDRKILSDSSTGNGPVFKHISGIDFDSQSQTLLVTDLSEKAIFAVDTSTGNRTVISR